jgi:tetratricopeptide (TPR) repeat protein
MKLRASPRTTHAIIVGVERYRTEGWSLEGPGLDGVTFAEWLTGRGVPAANIHVCMSVLQHNESSVKSRLDKIGVAVSGDAGRDSIRSMFTAKMPGMQGDLLFIFWGGHGFVSDLDARGLLYATASDVDPDALDFNSLRGLLRSERVHIRTQIGFVDTCANYFQRARWNLQIQQDRLPQDGSLGKAEQIFLFAAAPGQVTTQSRFQRTSAFSEFVNNWLAKSNSNSWPPNPLALFEAVDKHFKNLHKRRTTRQQPAYYVLQNDGKTEERGTLPFSVKLPDWSEKSTGLAGLRPPREPVRDFVGYSVEFATLKKVLKMPFSSPVCLIEGMPGAGKTELALAISNTVKGSYRDASLFIDLRGTTPSPLSPSEAMQICVRAFRGSSLQLPTEVAELEGLYRSTLEGKRVLLVLDDARDHSQVAALLPPTGCAALITSRNAIALPNLTSAKITMLSVPEAVSLLRRIAPRLTIKQAEAVAKLCGYLPLALRAAGSFLRVTRDKDPEEYVQELRDERKRLAHLSVEGMTPGVEASFNLSYKTLDSQTASVFRKLAVFPGSFDAVAEEFICEDHGHDHLASLLRRSLVLYDAQTRRYELHSLVRLFARGLLKNRERHMAARRHAVHYSDRTGMVADLFAQSGPRMQQALRAIDSEWHNIISGQKWAEDHFRRDSAAARACSSYQFYGWELFELRQLPLERIPHLQLALEAARGLNDNVSEVRHKLNLGLALMLTGQEREGEQELVQALALAERVEDKIGECDALNLLGELLVAKERNAEASEFFARALATAEQIGDLRRQGIALDNLGVVTTNPAQKKAYLQRALRTFRTIGDLRGDAITTGNLGYYYLLSEQRSNAIQQFRKQLKTTRKVHDRQREGIARYNIAKANFLMGRNSEALKNLEQAALIGGEVGDRWNQREALALKATVLEATGKFGPGLKVGRR